MTNANTLRGGDEGKNRTGKTFVNTYHRGAAAAPGGSFLTRGCPTQAIPVGLPFPASPACPGRVYYLLHTTPPGHNTPGLPLPPDTKFFLKNFFA